MTFLITIAALFYTRLLAFFGAMALFTTVATHFGLAIRTVLGKMPHLIAIFALDILGRTWLWTFLGTMARLPTDRISIYR